MQINIDFNYFKKINCIFKFEYFMSFLFGMLGAMSVLLIAHQFQYSSPEIATVNITKIIKDFTNKEANKNLSESILKNETKIFGLKLEKNIANLSKEYHLVIFPSEAVIAGTKDYTDIVMQKVNQS